jgi:hypothetical protein
MSPATVEPPPAALTQHWLDNLPTSRRFAASVAATEDLPFLMEMTARHIPALSGAYADVLRVHQFSSSILAARDQRGLVGGWALLFLNQAGRDAMLDGTFDVACPDTRLLCPTGQKATALYAWALCLPGTLVAAMGNFMDLLRRPAYAEADIYARPGTPKGEQFMIRTGFYPLSDAKPSLWVYRRVKPFVQAAE